MGLTDKTRKMPIEVGSSSLLQLAFFSFFLLDNRNRTHPIFESDFDCLTEICQLETQRLANRHQPSMPRPLSMASSSRSSCPTLKANMWCFSSTHLTSPLSAQLRSLPSPRESSSSRRSAARLLPVQLTPSSPTLPGPTRHVKRAASAP